MTDKKIEHKSIEGLEQKFRDMFEGANASVRFDYTLNKTIIDMIWNFFLPHLISSDEIKREAEYRTTYAPILEKSAVHRFIEDLDDRTIYDKEELLGIWAESYLTQSKEGGE